MDYLNNYIADPSLIEPHIAHLAQTLDIAIPPHPEIDGIHILLRLKPPHWRLREFYEYMNCLSTCLQGTPNPDETGFSLRIFLGKGRYFFRLDNNLDSDDVDYLLRDLIGISPLPPLLPDITGEDLAQGRFPDWMGNLDRNKVSTFFDISREFLQFHLNAISYFISREGLRNLLHSELDVYSDYTWSKAIESIYPQVSCITSTTERSPSPTSHFEGIRG